MLLQSSSNASFLESPGCETLTVASVSVHLDCKLY